MNKSKILQAILEELQKKNNTICYVLEDLKDNNVITREEHFNIRQFIHFNKPLDAENHPHWWSIDDVGTQKRINLINRLMKDH